MIVAIRVIKLKSVETLDDHKPLTKKNVDDVSKSKKGKKKSKSRASTIGDKSITSEAHTEHSYLLDTPESRAAAENLRQMLKDGASNAPSTKRKQTLSVKAMFTLVMSDGMTMTLHTTKGTKPISMILNGKEIVWKTAKLFAKKRSSLNLLEIVSIAQGKTTETFRLSGGNAPDDCCFSIITKDYTVDLQVSSKVERDAVVQGFLALMHEASEESTKNPISRPDFK